MSIEKVYLELTDKCNLNCKICYREAWNHSPVHMNKELLDIIISQITEIKEVKHIIFGGIGEPTLSPFIVDVIEKLSKFNITITTNGTILNDEINQVLVKNADEVVVSIDGLEVKYEKLRGTKLTKVEENVKNLIRTRESLNLKQPNICFQFVASEDNIDDIFGIVDLAADIGVNKLIISNLLPQTKENSHKILYRRYENKEMKHLFNKVRNYSFKKGINLILPNIELKTERRCNFINENAVYVTSSGDIVPCYRFSHSYTEFVFGRKKVVQKYSFGNIKENSLIDIWDNREYETFRKSVYYSTYPSCIDCDLVDGCDMVNDTDTNCYGISPSCGDCLWSRNIIICP